MNRKGFTLIEVVIAVVVIASLIGFVLALNGIASGFKSDAKHKCEVWQKYVRTADDSLKYELLCE